MDKKVLSFGELLLRICPDTEGNWLRENSLPSYVGGAEANVATALALWGIPSSYLTVLPDNSVARQLVAYLDANAVDTSKILFGGDRLGLYFLPAGKDLKNTGVIYDRAYSSFSRLKPGTIDWDVMLDDVAWLHFSSISPALNQAVAEVCKEGLQAAASKGVRVSVDLNYRPKLWQYGAAPAMVMPELVAGCDLVMGNLWAAEKMLGIPVDVGLTERDRKEDYLEHALRTSRQIVERFPRVTQVAKTFRFDRGEKGIRYYAALYSAGKFYSSREYVTDTILDKVGSGDCFMAGLIRGVWLRQSPGEMLDFATAAAFQKLFVPGDATSQRVEDIEKFIVTHEQQ